MKSRTRSSEAAATRRPSRSRQQADSWQNAETSSIFIGKTTDAALFYPGGLHQGDIAEDPLPVLAEENVAAADPADQADAPRNLVSYLKSSPGPRTELLCCACPIS